MAEGKNNRPKITDKERMHKKIRLLISIIFLPAVVPVICMLSCAEQHVYDVPMDLGEEVRLTFLHTSDIHSRLLPFRMEVTYTDNSLGLLQENEPFGGIARVGHIINRERARGGRIAYVDSGDVFQGAPIFNVFHGEAEFRAMSYLKPDAMAIGNHEFDTGLTNLIKQTKSWITFPFLAANYYFMPDNELGELSQPYTIINMDGIKVGLIGLGDFGSLSSVTDIGNSLKIMPINMEQVVEDHVHTLRPYCDLIMLVSHAGLSDDQEIAAATSGVDIIFGGHLHIVLNPPKVVKNKVGENVLLVHSGAFAKYVGRLDVVVRKDATGRMRIMSHDYELFPVDSTVPEDPKLAQIMEEYRFKLNQAIDLTSVFGYSPKLLTKYGYEGGDSSLGNLVSEAIRKYARVDIAFTNTLGIRANMYPGPITLDDLFNVFPFENSITLMYMSGTDLRNMLDYVAQRSSGRGCVSQLQVAGVEFVMNCNSSLPPAYADCHNWEKLNFRDCTVGCDPLPDCTDNCVPDPTCLSECIQEFKNCVVEKTGKVEDALCLNRCLPEKPKYFFAKDDEKALDCMYDCFPRAEKIALTNCPNPMLVTDPDSCILSPLVEQQVYETATNDYIAHGGSGFTILKSNNTQEDTGLPLREAVLEVILTAGSCLEFCRDRDDDLNLGTCSVYQGCLENITEFYGSFCDRMDKTGGSKITGEISGCAVDTGSCWYDSHCYYPAEDCTDGTCKTCKNSSECLVDDPNSLCADGFCLPRTHACVEGRCVRSCEADTDCPGMDSEREVQCVRGRCQPVPAVSCLANNECANPYAVCFGDSAPCNGDEECEAGFQCRQKMCVPVREDCSKDKDCPADKYCVKGMCTTDRQLCTADKDCPEGRCDAGACTLPCGNCLADTDCPGGLECIKNYCIHRHAMCDGFRCRTYCDGIQDCKSGEDCRSGLCQPAACFTDLTAEKACRLNAAWRANEKCSTVPCVDSRVDGRIGRILPENLDELEFGFVPENPEDIDYE
jgi:2',3'-cyclic-nucleotide 2'-phosphodiesterase (5'-nucleotidase family)